MSQYIRWPNISTSLTSTTSTVSFNVAPAGNDANPGTPSSPFLTIQGALNALPKRIRNQVDINVAAGTSYAGFNVEGFVVDPIDPSLPCGIRIMGQLVTATLAAGTATGTITGTVAGNSAVASFAVLTDSGQSWTVNALTGLLVEILTGTSTGSIFPIASNTATSITVLTGAALGAVNGTYAIRDWASIITTGVAIPPVLPIQGAAAGGATINGYSVFNNVFTTTQNLRIENLKINMSSGTRCANWISTGGIMDRCWLGGTPILTFSVDGPIKCIVQQCVIMAASTATALTIQGAGMGTTTFANCLVSGLGGGTAMSPTCQGADLSVSQCLMTSFGFGININKSCNITLTGTRITGMSSQGIRTRGGLGTGSYVSLSASGLDISNTSTGLEMFGPCFGQFTTLTGTGNGIGINLTTGSRCQVASTSTITGTTEVIVDGTSTTLALMRAATPKLISSPYFSIIQE